MDKAFRAKYSNAVFRSAMMFGIETWGSASTTLLDKVQQLQNQAYKIAVPRDKQFKSARQRQKLLNWLPVRTEIERATHLMTYKIINSQSPQELAALMPTNTKGYRMTEHKKLACKPKYLCKNKLTRSLYRSRAYLYNTLPKKITTQPNATKLKKELKAYLKTIVH